MYFNRVCSIFSLVMLTFLLNACSGGAPESTVETFYKAAASGDVDKATGLISLAEVPAAEMLQAKGKIQMIVGEMQSRIQANDGLKTVEIIKTEMDESGKEATVQSRVIFKNGKDMTEVFHLIKEDGGWKIKLG